MDLIEEDAMALIAGDGLSSYVPEEDRSSALGAVGQFTMDPAPVATLERGIGDAVAKLDTRKQAIDQPAQIAPPGEDPFSANVTDEFGKTAGGGPAALLDVHNQFKEVLIKTRDNIRANAAALQGQDDASSTSFSGGA